MTHGCTARRTPDVPDIPDIPDVPDMPDIPDVPDMPDTPEPPEVMLEDTSFDIAFVDYEIRDSYCQLQLHMTRFPEYESVTVDWGDGTVEEWTDYLVWHNYRAVGRFTIRIGRQAKWFRLWDCYTVTTDRRVLTSRPQMWLNHWSDYLESCEGSFCGWSDPDHGGLCGTLPRWGWSTKDTFCCFQFCFDITGGFPEWTPNIVDATGTFDRCTGLAGEIPRWGENITDVSQCFCDCPGATGTIPPWPRNCVGFNSCYKGCTGLVGEIPPWPATAQELDSVYKDCAGLVGIIPPWPEGMTMCSGCYWNCAGLTGAWTDDPALLMPEEKVRYSPDSEYYRCYDVVTGCSDAVRSLFWDKHWGGTIPRPTPAPRGP